MSEEIIAVIDDLSKRLGFAIDWSTENITPIVTELIKKYSNYLLGTNIFYLVLSLTFLFFAGTVLVFVGKEIVKRKEWVYGRFGINIEVVLVVIVAFIIEACALIATVIFSVLVIKSLTIPEIYAAQELLELVSSL